jgi:hypothetical protein
MLLPDLSSLEWDDLEPIQVPVRVGQKRYVLREASEAAAATYRNAGLRSARMNDGKVVGIEGAADVQALLVSLCLFHFVAGKDGQQLPIPVSLEAVRSWPARVVLKLFERAKQISDLDETETREVLEKRLAETQEKLAALGHVNGEGAAKNLLPATPATSDSPAS